MGDPFLNHFALGVLIFVVIMLFYGIIAIHDLPHLVATGRGHLHQDAIHAAGWISLLTLHALWPFLWIRGMAYKLERGCGLFAISPLLQVMSYNHPFSTNAHIYFATTLVLSAVKGRAVEVPVEPNAPLKAGDVLFRIDPVPFQNALDERRAALAEAEQNVGLCQFGTGPAADCFGASARYFHR